MSEKTALLIRVDRIGDLVLTMASDQLPALHGYKCHWAIAKNLGFIAQLADPPREYTEFDVSFSIASFHRFYKFVRRLNPQVSITFFAPWWVNLALFLAFVPKRLGRYSQWHSFLFLTQGLRQKRSLGQKHESDFNFELCELLDNSPRPERLHLKLQRPRTDVLTKFSLIEKTYIVIHPGMGGSALNWPTKNYIEVIKELCKKYRVLITGTSADKKYIDPIKKACGGMQKLYFADEQLNSTELIEVLACAKAVLAPSTGVTHLAAATGVPTIGLYSPIATEQPQRWQPRGDQVTVLTPDVEVKVSHPPEVMEQIRVQQVLEKIYSLIEVE